MTLLLQATECCLLAGLHGQGHTTPSFSHATCGFAPPCLPAPTAEALAAVCLPLRLKDTACPLLLPVAQQPQHPQPLLLGCCS